MPAEELNFAMRLQDQTSRSAGDAATSLKALESELRKVEIQTMRLELAQQRAQMGPKTLAQATREHAFALRIQRAELQHQQSVLKEQESAVGKLGKGFQSLQKIAGGALHYVGERIAGLAMAAPGLAVAGARFAVDALAFKESTLASYELMLGGPKQAREMFASNLYLAKKTPFETEDVVTAMKQIMSAGFDTEEANVVFQAIGDVSAASGFNKEVFGQLALAFSQIKGAGRLMGQELLQVLNATAQAGVGRQQIFEQIAKLKGAKPGDMRKAMEGGNISSMEAIVGIVNAIKEKSGGRVGEIMMRQSSTLKGLFSTLSSAPMDFFLSMDLDKLEGLNPFKRFIENLVGDEGLLNTATASGRRLQTALESTFNRVFGGIFGGLAGEAGKARLESGLMKVIDGFGALVDGIMAFGSGFKSGFEPFIAFMDALDEKQGSSAGFVTGMEKLGSAMGYVSTAIGVAAVGAGWALDGFFALFDPARNPAHPANLLDNLELVGSSIKFWWSDLKNWFKNIWIDAKGLATDLVLGFVTGIEEKLGLPAGSALKMVSSTVGTVKDALGIHSPSRVFEEVGANVAQGYALGVDDGAPGASAAVRRMVAPRGDVDAAGRAGGVTVVVQPGAVQISVEGAGPDAEALYQRLATRLRDSLPALLEGAVAEAGLLGAGGG